MYVYTCAIYLTVQFNYACVRLSGWLMEKAMATHSSTLAWKIPWTEEPGRVQSMGSLRVRHSWATSLSPVTFMHWKRKWQPTSVFLPGESQGRGAWWAAIYGVTQSWTRRKWLSSSSSSSCFLFSLTLFHWTLFYILCKSSLPWNSLLFHPLI